MTIPDAVPTGPFTWAMVKALGTPRHQLESWVSAGEVRRVLHGVYQRHDEPDTPIARAQAAALVITQFTVVCDRTASWIHGVDTFDYQELEILPPVETWVLRDRPRVRRQGCVGGRRDLAPHDVMRIEPIVVTTPLRTALDLACRLGRRDALAALDGFMRLHGLTHDDLRLELSRYRRRRGVVQLRQLVPLASPLSESPGESWTRLCIIDADIPCPQPQYWVMVDGEPFIRLDLAYPRHRVAVEYDGVEFHDSPEQRSHDEARRAWLRSQGWTVIVVRKDSFGQHAREAWLSELRDALRRAERAR